MIERFSKMNTQTLEILMMCLLTHTLKVVNFVMLKLYLNEEVVGRGREENVGIFLPKADSQGERAGQGLSLCNKAANYSTFVQMGPGRSWEQEN